MDLGKRGRALLYAAAFVVILVGSAMGSIR